jgi:ABC-type transporter Mla MlaB component
MIRIVKLEESASTTFTVDGQLSSESLEAVETCCNQALSTGKPVHLFLRNVSVIDEHGRALLCRLTVKGVVLTAAGVYCSYVVGEINRGIGAPHP